MNEELPKLPARTPEGEDVFGYEAFLGAFRKTLESENGNVLDTSNGARLIAKWIYHCPHAWRDKFDLEASKIVGVPSVCDRMVALDRPKT